jgi:gas vesicle protein
MIDKVVGGVLGAATALIILYKPKEKEVRLEIVKDHGDWVEVKAC